MSARVLHVVDVVRHGAVPVRVEPDFLAAVVDEVHVAQPRRQLALDTPPQRRPGASCARVARQVVERMRVRVDAVEHEAHAGVGVVPSVVGERRLRVAQDALRLAGGVGGAVVEALPEGVDPRVDGDALRVDVHEVGVESRHVERLDVDGERADGESLEAVQVLDVRRPRPARDPRDAAGGHQQAACLQQLPRLRQARQHQYDGGALLKQEREDDRLVLARREPVTHLDHVGEADAAPLGDSLQVTEALRVVQLRRVDDGDERPVEAFEQRHDDVRLHAGRRDGAHEVRVLVLVAQDGARRRVADLRYLEESQQVRSVLRRSVVLRADQTDDIITGDAAVRAR